MEDGEAVGTCSGVFVREAGCRGEEFVIVERSRGRWWIGTSICMRAPAVVYEMANDAITGGNSLLGRFGQWRWIGNYVSTDSCKVGIVGFI